MHDQTALLFELFAIFVAAKVVGEIFRTSPPSCCLGRNSRCCSTWCLCIGLCAPNDPPPSITEIGAIFVLFHAGLEVSPPDLIPVGRKALLVAALGIVVPFALRFC